MAENKKYTEYSSKDYVDKKTSILPYNIDVTLLEETELTEYGVDSNNYKCYFFDSSLLIEKYPKTIYLNITYNDRNVDISKNVELNIGDDDLFYFEDEDMTIKISSGYYDKDLSEWIDRVIITAYKKPNENEEIIPYDIKKISIKSQEYTNLLTDEMIDEINFDKLYNVDPYLKDLCDGTSKSLYTPVYNKLLKSIFYKWTNDDVNQICDDFPYTGSSSNQMSGNSTVYINVLESEGWKGIKILNIRQYNFGAYTDNLCFTAYNCKVKIIKKITWNDNNTTSTIKDLDYSNKSGVIVTYRLDTSNTMCKNYDLYILFTKSNTNSGRVENLRLTANHNPNNFLGYEDIPTKTSQLINDSDLITKKYVDDSIASSGAQIDETELNTMLNDIYGFSDVN